LAFFRRDPRLIGPECLRWKRPKTCSSLTQEGYRMYIPGIVVLILIIVLLAWLL
jgi:hypothetical protein